MTTCMPLLWKYDDDAPTYAGRIQQGCLCGRWHTDTYSDTETNRARLVRSGAAHAKGGKP